MTLDCKGFRFDFLRDIKMRDDRRIFCPLFILAIKYAPLPPSFKFYLAEPLLLTVVSPSYSNLPPLQISHLSTIFLSPPKRNGGRNKLREFSVFLFENVTTKSFSRMKRVQTGLKLDFTSENWISGHEKWILL